MAASRRESHGRLAGQRIEAGQFQGRALGIDGHDPADERPRPSAGSGVLLRDAPDDARTRPFGALDEGRRQDRAGPPGQLPHEQLGAWVAHVRDEDRRRETEDRACRRCGLQPAGERGDDGSPVGKDIRVVPLSACDDRDGRVIRIEVAGVFIGLDHEGPPRTEPGRGRDAAGQRGRQERTNERGRVLAGGDEHVDEPACRRALAMRTGHADERPPDRCVRDDLLPRFDRDMEPAGRLELRMIRVYRGKGFGHGKAVRSRGLGHVGRIVVLRDDDALGDECGKVRRAARDIAAIDQRPESVGQERRTARARPASPNDVDPFTADDGTGGPRRLKTGPDRVPAATHPLVPGRASAWWTSNSRAACTLDLTFPARSPVQTNRLTSAPAASATAM